MTTDVEARVELLILSTVKPSDLPETIEGLMGCFGKLEREWSAFYILRLMRSKGCWAPFSKAELNGLEPTGHYWFNGLDHPDWTTERPDGLREVTARFVVRAAGLAGDWPADQRRWGP